MIEEVNYNKVILIGDDHHNILGLVRSFGVNSIKPYGIIINNATKKCFVNRSRYWANTYIVESYEEVINVLESSFVDEKLKPVIIPCSDKAGKLLDLHLDKLINKYIIPSIDNKQGAITELMDKELQVDFAKKNDIPIAETWIAKCETWKNTLESIEYPCIVKPVSSYEGNKSDIKKCENEIELKEYLAFIFGEKEYRRILIQKFINFDYEIEFIGSFTRTDNSYILSKTHRHWPVVGGTNSYFGIIDEPSINEISKKILKIFDQINFSGLFDIELFNVGGEIFLNEINWRNTGNSFFALGSGVHYAVVWYYSVIEKHNGNIKHISNDVTQYAMNEATDLRHVVFGKYSFIKWNKERKYTQSFALWFNGDQRPTYKRYSQLLINFLRRNKK